LISKELKYVSNWDKNGLMWYLGANDQQQSIDINKIEKQLDLSIKPNTLNKDIINHIFTGRSYRDISWSTSTETNDCLKWEFKSPSVFSLEGYIIRGGDYDNQIRNWTLIGISPTGQDIILDHRIDSSIYRSDSSVYFKLDKPSDLVVGIKIVRTGNSSHRTSNMSISGLEFYGTYYNAGW
jgi:hypothetical protein